MKIFHDLKIVSDVQRKAISNIDIAGTDLTLKQLLDFGQTETRVLSGLTAYYKDVPGFADTLVSVKLKKNATFYFIEDIPLSILGNKIGETGLVEKKAWIPTCLAETFHLDQNNKVEIWVKATVNIPLNSIFFIFDTYRIPG